MALAAPKKLGQLEPEDNLREARNSPEEEGRRDSFSDFSVLDMIDAANTIYSAVNRRSVQPEEPDER